MHRGWAVVAAQQAPAVPADLAVVQVVIVTTRNLTGVSRGGGRQWVRVSSRGVGSDSSKRKRVRVSRGELGHWVRVLRAEGGSWVTGHAEDACRPLSSPPLAPAHLHPALLGLILGPGLVSHADPALLHRVVVLMEHRHGTDTLHLHLIGPGRKGWRVRSE